MSSPKGNWVPPAYQASVNHLMPPEVWTLTLNRYQRDNLLQLLQRLMGGDDTPLTCFNTGDWVGEVRWMLGKKNSPNFGPAVVQVYEVDDADSPMPPHQSPAEYGSEARS